MARARYNGQSLAWFLIGVGLGSIVSLLFAPAAGDDLREQLVSSAREGADRARQTSHDALDAVRDFADRSQEKAKAIADKARGISENARSHTSDAAERGPDAIAGQVDNL